MANEIFTRIQLKYDSYANWTSANPTLLAGEVAIAKLVTGTQVDATNDTTNTAPVLFKVGPGAFNSLPWVSGLAADVYAWAKKPNPDWTDFPALPIVIVDNEEGKFVTDFEYTNNTITIHRANVAWGDITGKPDLALDEDVGNVDELTTTAKTVVGAINEHDTEIGNLASLNTTNKGNLVAAINEALQAVEVGGTGSVVTVTKETTPTEGSEVTYTVNQGGKAVDVKIEIPKYDTKADYGVLEIGAGTGIEITGDDDQKPIIGVKANTYDAYGAAATVKTGVEDGTIKAKSAELADSATTAEKVAKKLTVGAKNFDGSAEVTITAADLGLDTVMHFVGAFATAPTKAFAGTANERELANGDVYLNTANTTEYVYSNGKWVELGNEEGAGSHALKTIKVEGTGYLTGGGTLEQDRTIDITDTVKTKIEHGETAYGWGDHANAGYKTQQTAVIDHNLSGATVVKGIAQNENGEITVSTRNLTPADIGAQAVGSYKTIQTAVGDKFVKDNSIITKLTQNENGVIEYEIEEVTARTFGGVEKIKGSVIDGDAIGYISVNGAVDTPTAPDENGEVELQMHFFDNKFNGSYIIDNTITTAKLQGARKSLGTDNTTDIVIFNCGSATTVL